MKNVFLVILVSTLLSVFYFSLVSLLIKESNLHSALVLSLKNDSELSGQLENRNGALGRLAEKIIQDVNCYFDKNKCENEQAQPKITKRFSLSIVDANFYKNFMLDKSIFLQSIYIFIYFCCFIAFIKFFSPTHPHDTHTLAVDVLIFNGPPMAGILGTLLAFGDAISVEGGADVSLLTSKFGEAIYTTIFGGSVYILVLALNYLQSIKFANTSNSKTTIESKAREENNNVTTSDDKGY